LKHFVETGPKNTIYAITDNDTLWEFNEINKYWSKYKLLEAFPKLVVGVKGGVKCKNNYTWFFKSNFKYKL
jgi:hypothetical protein